VEEALDKPAEVLNLYDVSEQLFRILRENFPVGDHYVLPLENVDAAEAELRSLIGVAAMAMRKLQALRLISKPDERTSNDVVVGLCAELNRALCELVGHLPTQELRTELGLLLVKVNEAGRSVALLNVGEVVVLR
jgi:hypothetical protein